MRIKVYQIDEKLDKHNKLYRSYDSTLKSLGGVDPGIYKTVYDGNVDADNLEVVFELCNIEPPVGYNGHSMSVSDVIELENSKCYFCNSVGFRQLENFDSSKVAPITGHRMLVIEPHKAPYEMIIPNGLEALQQAVRGYIECTYPFDDNTFVIGNEEAKLIGLEGNRRINGGIYAGNLLIAADDGNGGTADLTDEQISKYTKMFQTPEDISPDEVQDDIWYEVTSFDY